MATEIDTKYGDCPTHGGVEGTRALPKVTFPPLYTSIKRALAKRRPYVCPECGSPVQTGD